MSNAPLRILIVDDYEMVRVMLKRCLAQLGYTQVEEATDGKMALEMVQKASDSGKGYTVIFSDLNMPVMNGFEFLGSVRKSPALGKPPCVLISAEAKIDFITQALQQGANDYIIKPFSTQTLQKKIEKINELIKRQSAQPQK